MISTAFDYERPATLEGALHLLAFHGDGARVLAGGHSLIPLMKLRLAEPSVLVDIGAIPGLDRIVYEDEHFTIGALTTHAALAASPDLRRHAPVFSDAAGSLGDPQVRNRGTVGGACAHADPACDYAAALLALGATFRIVGRERKREVAADEFFLGMFDTAVKPGEILYEISFEAAPHSAYAKYPHPASHYPLVGVAARLSLDGNRIGDARVALTGLADAAFRARGVEAALRGIDASDSAALREACSNAAAGVTARADLEASSAYRAAMADVFALRAVDAARTR